MQCLTRRLLDRLRGAAPPGRLAAGPPLRAGRRRRSRRARSRSTCSIRRGERRRLLGVEALAAERGISLRTGCFCNPGASETARGITAAEMEAVFALGRQPDYEDLRRLLPGKALGAVRVSLGIATTQRDVSRLVDFVESLAGRPWD